MTKTELLLLRSAAIQTQAAAVESTGLSSTQISAFLNNERGIKVSDLDSLFQAWKVELVDISKGVTIVRTEKYKELLLSQTKANEMELQNLYGTEEVPNVPRIIVDLEDIDLSK